MNGLYTIKQMTTWISGYLENKGFETEIYSDKLLPARVPVYASKAIRKGKPNSVEEIVVDVITSARIKSGDFFYTLRIPRTLAEKPKELPNASSAIFFQYYFPRAKIYWAYPDYLNLDEEFSKFVQLCKAHKIGLFKVGQEKVEENKSTFAVSVIESVFEKFKLSLTSIQESSIKSFKEKKLLQDLLNRLYDELDRHIERTNDYLIYYPDPEYRRREIVGGTEGRYISRTLIDKLAEIENLSYKVRLLELSYEYRRRTEDDYDIALNLIEALWDDFGLEYPKFQKGFEPVLLLDPGYRDHFLHQFHVFLLGCYIIDRMYSDKIFSTSLGEYDEHIEDIWLFASTYHDYNYNIQNYDIWIKTFFKKSLFFNENPSQLRLDECYVKEDYMFKTKELCDEAFGMDVDRTTLLFFYDKIIDKKNHGLLGALSLLKLFDGTKVRPSKKKLERKQILRAAKAIALHDEEIWLEFSGINKSEFFQRKVIEKLEFGNDPVSFLLIFCDTLQEWGRVGRKYEETRARLDDVGIENGLVWVNISVRDEDAFNQKKSEIDRVKKFLFDERFKIKLSTREKGSLSVERYMEGK